MSHDEIGAGDVVPAASSSSAIVSIGESGLLYRPALAAEARAVGCAYRGGTRWHAVARGGNAVARLWHCRGVRRDTGRVAA